MIRKTAEKLSYLACFMQSGFEEETEQTKAFMNRMNNLYKKYGLDATDDIDCLEEMLSNWDDSQIKALDGELDMIKNRYEDLLNAEDSNDDTENNENSDDEDIVDSDDDTEEESEVENGEETEDDFQEETDEEKLERKLRLANALKEDAAKGKAEAQKRLNELLGIPEENSEE